MLCHPGNHLNCLNNIVPTLITAIVFFTVYFSFSGLVVKHMKIKPWCFIYCLFFHSSTSLGMCSDIYSYGNGYDCCDHIILGSLLIIRGLFSFESVHLKKYQPNPSLSVFLIGWWLLVEVGRFFFIIYWTLLVILASHASWAQKLISRL